MLLVKLPVNSKLLVVKFWGSQKSYMDFQCLLTLALFKDQLYRNRVKVSNCQEMETGMGREVSVAVKRQHEESLWP